MIPIYHITHIKNLASIIDQMGLHCDRYITDNQVDCIGIGHKNIKDRRMKRVVNCGKRGTVGDYVPFYYAPRSPMLYVINKGGVEGYKEGQEPILHLVASAERAVQMKLAYVCSDGHADVAYTGFFTELNELGSRIDWEIMQSKYWHDTPEHIDRKRKRQAEFLIHDFAPWTLFNEIGVCTSKMKQSVEGILASVSHKPLVTVQRDWYY